MLYVKKGQNGFKAEQRTKQAQSKGPNGLNECHSCSFFVLLSCFTLLGRLHFVLSNALISQCPWGSGLSQL